MGLNKFDPRRLHQMRSGKSYLRGYLYWDNDAPTTCPQCGKSPKSFEYVMLPGLTREPARNRHSQAVSYLGPDAPVWCSAALLGALSRFIRSTKTSFPVGMFCRSTSAAASISSRLSNVVFWLLYLITGGLGLCCLFFKIAWSVCWLLAGFPCLK